MIKINKLNPFGKMCVTLGMLPSSYKESLSYEEQLIWFCNFLENQVIPAINKEGEAIEELQNLYIELKNYVDNYFENLDVQEEINNKLDDMAESGELENIIGTYLQLAGILTYNTLDDIVNAENIAEGSICYCLGYLTYNDGKGGFYKIRTITSGDTVDGFNIVALDISDTLIAERMPNYYINEINNTLSSVTSNLTSINSNLDIINSERTILIGDSYSLDRRPDVNITGWAIPLQELLGLNNDNCYIIQDNGGGFTVSGSHGTFLQGLTNLEVSDKTTIKNIIVCGGLNDIQANDKATIKTAISSFMTYVKTNYPNAKVYIGMIGWNLDDLHTSDNQLIRYYVLDKVLPAYQECSEYGAIYLNGVENVMHDKTQYYDGAHPNQTMCDRLAQYIYQALKNGYASITYPDHTITFTNNNIDLSYFSIKEKIVNNMTILFDNNEYGNGINITSDYPTVGNYNIYLGEINLNYFSPCYMWDELLTAPAIVKDVDNNSYQCQCTLYIKFYDYCYARFIGNPSIEGKQIKEINLLSPYSCKPSVSH